MKTYAIWIEGYRATGEHGTAYKAASGIEASSFEEAVKKFARTKEAEDCGNFNEKHLTFWGCRTFDNENDARKSYG